MSTEFEIRPKECSKEVARLEEMADALKQNMQRVAAVKAQLQNDGAYVGVVDAINKIESDLQSEEKSVRDLKAVLEKSVALYVKTEAKISGGKQGIKFPWSWGKKKEQEDDIQKKDYYDALPEELKKYITEDDLVITDDGFVMCMKSLADIMEEMGVAETADGSVQSYYDDWYIYGIMDDDGNMTYSMIKMREKEYDASTGDGDDPGVTVSFIEFDINTLTSLDDTANQTDANIKKLTDEIDDVVRSNEVKHNKTLQKYFSDTKSEASYIVADEYINKIAQTATDNKVELPNNFDTAPKRVTDALEQLNKDAGYTIYDKKNGCININDPDNLTDEEKYAILAAYTSNVNYNSFAAEVEYHSDGLVNWIKYMPVIGEKEWYDSAIRADMAFGEEDEGIGNLFDPYFDLNSRIVKKQAKEHGER